MAQGDIPEGEVLEKLIVSVDDISGRNYWPIVLEGLKTRIPLNGLILENKFGKSVHVQELGLQFLLSKDPKLQRLKPFKHSTITWFRFPYANIIIVTAEESADYKANVRPKLRAMLDIEKSERMGDSLAEAVIVYVRPPETEPSARGPKKVFEKLQNDFKTKRHGQRCVRLDLFGFTPGQSHSATIAGLEDLENTLKDCVKASFQTRQAMYDEEVRKLMGRRLDTGWSFFTLYLVKDSFALMLENVGLLEDALREYFELEACYLEALTGVGALNNAKFGGDEHGEDVASLMTASWKRTRQAVMSKKGLTEFKFRQYLFSSQARLLIKLGRPVEVLERGLKFIQTLSSLLMDREKSGELRSLFREAWSFSACMSLACSTVKVYRALEERHIDDLLDTAFNQKSPWSAVEKLELSDVDWNVGVSGLEQMTSDLDLSALGGKRKKQLLRSRDGRLVEGRERHFYCLLGHLYASAREELRRIGEAFEVETPHESLAVHAGITRADLLPTFTPICLSPCRGRSSDTVGKSFAMRKASSMIESLQSKIEASMSVMSARSHGMSSRSSDVGLDLERAPSWMTRAGLTGKLPKHRRNNTAGPMVDLSRDSQTSFISLGSDAQPIDRSPLTPGTPLTPSMHTPTQGTSIEVSSGRSTGSRTSEDIPESPHLVADKARSEATEDDHSVDQRLTEMGNLRRASMSEVSGSGDGSAAGSSQRENIQEGGDVMLTGCDPLLHGESGLDTPPPQVTAAGVSPFSMDNKNWISDWRLRRALASEDLFEDLFVEVTLAAAWCYSRAGRTRTSAVMRADVAPLLLRHGMISTAQQLYQTKCEMYVKEGWHNLRAHVLPQLATCVRGIHPPVVVATCLSFLSLPEDSGQAVDRKAMQDEMVQCAKNLGDDVIDQQLFTGPALQISPAKCRFSCYCGEQDSQGGPVLTPRAQPCGSAQNYPGAILANAGDVVEVEVEIHSMLPSNLVIKDAVLSLSLIGARSTMTDMVSFQSQPQSPEVPRGLPRLPTFSKSTSIKDRRKLNKEGSIHDSAGARTERWLQCPQLLEDSETDSNTVVIQPGLTCVKFTCCPVQEGLYNLQYIMAYIESAPICIPIKNESRKNVQPVWQNANLRLKPSIPDGTVGGVAMSVFDDQVVLQVQPSTQRLALTAISPQSCLVSGITQWIGILLQSNTEQLKSGHLTLSPPVLTSLTELQKKQEQWKFGCSKAYVATIETTKEEGSTAQSTGGRKGQSTALSTREGWVELESGVVDLPSVGLRGSGVVVWCLVDLKKDGMMQENMHMSQRGMLGHGGKFEEALGDVDRSTGETVTMVARVDYISGCQRSHTGLLRLPVCSPFEVQTSVISAGKRDILITVTIVSQLPVPCKLDTVDLELPTRRKGVFRPNAMGLEKSCMLNALEMLSVMYRISVEQAEQLSPSSESASNFTGVVSVHYTITTFDSYPQIVRCNDYLGQNDLDLPPKLPNPPSHPPVISSKAKPSVQQTQQHEFRVSFTFDTVVGSRGQEVDALKVAFLNPMAVSVGVPVALTWMLERQGGSHKSEDVPYIISMDGPWQACVPLEGALWIPTISGASATLEGVFIPMADGDLPAPKLLLPQNKAQSQHTLITVKS